jgi:hypothetical protein
MSEKDLTVGHSEGVTYNCDNVKTYDMVFDGVKLRYGTSTTDNIKEFTIERVYDIDDEYCNGDLMDMRLMDGNGKIIMSGDYYHNKIEERVEGFFSALNYLEIKYTIKEVNRNEEF